MQQTAKTKTTLCSVNYFVISNYAISSNSSSAIHSRQETIFLMIFQAYHHYLTTNIYINSYCCCSPLQYNFSFDIPVVLIRADHFPCHNLISNSYFTFQSETHLCPLSMVTLTVVTPGLT